MMYFDFRTITYGKWILAGEHAVLRGHGALVFPVKSRQFILEYHANSSDLSADYAGEHGKEMHLLFWSVLEHGHRLLNQSLNRLHGHFNLTSNIPIGAGMGASAALCVAAARWFCAQGCIEASHIPEFARQLENLFHGQSSGLDIAGVACETGLYFQKTTTQTLDLAWQPHWYLSSCGQIGITSHCIQQVNQLWATNPQKAQKIDHIMHESVNKARQALETAHIQSMALLIEAIQDAGSCFKAWGLLNDELSQHIQWLYDNGALAVKPTGSGRGGYVLSLWQHKPEHLAHQWIEPGLCN